MVCNCANSSAPEKYFPTIAKYNNICHDGLDLNAYMDESNYPHK